VRLKVEQSISNREDGQLAEADTLLDQAKALFDKLNEDEVMPNQMKYYYTVELEIILNKMNLEFKKGNYEYSLNIPKSDLDKAEAFKSNYDDPFFMCWYHKEVADACRATAIFGNEEQKSDKKKPLEAAIKSYKEAIEDSEDRTDIQHIVKDSEFAIDICTAWLQVETAPQNSVSMLEKYVGAKQITTEKYKEFLFEDDKYEAHLIRAQAFKNQSKNDEAEQECAGARASFDDLPGVLTKHQENLQARLNEICPPEAPSQSDSGNSEEEKLD